MSTQVAYFEAWRDLMRSWGFTVLEADGWRTRDAEPRSTYLPGMLYVEHHDASTKLSGNWGALAYVITNRLANIVTARDGQIMLCAAGVAWHAGVGAYPGIPDNGANARSLGNEVANSGSEPYSDACTRSIVAGEKAWAIVSGRAADRVIGHKEWAMPRGRKTDPVVDMNQRRRDVAAYSPEDDMTPEQDRMLRRVYEELAKPAPSKVADSTWQGTALQFAQNTNAYAYHLFQELPGLKAAIAKLAEAVASGRDDLTAEEITAAVDEGIRRGGAAVLAAQEAAHAARPDAGAS
jgi:hypothetical protein